MRITACGRTAWRSLTASMLLAATWQLTGCTSAHRPVDVEDSFFGSEQAYRSRYGVEQKPVDGPPVSAEAPAAPNAFTVSNPRISSFVDTFKTRWRNFYQGALERGSRYLPKMTRVMEEESLPPELAYLPLIESGFRTHAVSHAGAVGPWQFIRATGRRYGLRIDGYVDERRDPVKSTHAAAKYLKDLYAQFGDWHLSLAAYNTGETNVARVIERGHTDYWEMSRRGYLAAETCDFVPQFLAALQIAKSPEAYGFESPSGDPLQYDLVRIDRSVSLRTVAKLSNASVSEITELNPALHRGVTPPQGYTVRVPKGTKEIVQTALAQMHREAAQLLPARTVVVTQRTYTLRRGETLAAVAKRHRVSVTSLMRANGLRNARRVAAGRVLRIPGTAPTAKVVAHKQAPIRVALRRKAR